ncbi:hypothetical protein VF14_18260 [Nostoc linckia z18]|uniref:DUF6876 domain-containing protein n=1 Tax=Nostoc linckia z8 TaxID=1628746 RepID=A0A9Q5Z929_NOSLI|nr:DUF6876 family protein [Nostoc linckia]PHJ81984.1 hypothetical protein VF07_29270 [Nostoc linckia z6]PHK00795.1 hypothetical protein VF08_23260 [Nostoc linckia z8]PHK09328.1 hypothetical protein VF09_16045 [Nostoc linckia z9]PHK33068.1 hypothetical protein VF14_18260 [Nostoc linckia z18]
MSITLEDLSHFSGSLQWFPHSFNPRFLYTEGVLYLGERGQAFWLIDLIFSWQPEISRQKVQVFQMWLIEVNLEAKTAVITATDGNNNQIARQEIEHTDFPLEKLKLYVQFDGEHSTLMLPSEY